ncbi:alpha/beta-hydrolase [Macrolepiota fuliginosa MF-IS2]|uniref:Alpha/beta-hydrolase n=1 Tax=Macrolepiota fuliginosa MF-IS2 TaxID=1400762 RepID=A0A9P5X8L7_9AGAR|nr:alpha/beta-hydrolase [Macrolepiota fuliginosa MF-IS2]
MEGSFTTFESRFIKSADDTEIYADAAGTRSPAAPVLVLIHGFSMNKAAFNPMFEDRKWLSSAFLVRYDARGQGKSRGPLDDEGWESRRMSEDFEAVCKEFGVTKAFVLGWSLGAAHFVDIINYNTSVTISGFINSSGLMYISPPVIFRMAKPEALVILAELTQTGSSIEAFQSTAQRFCSFLSDDLTPDLRRALLEGIMLVSSNVAGKLSTRAHDPEKMLQEGRDGGLEVLVVTGGKDKLVNATGVRETYEESGWKKCIHRHLEEGDHMPWLSRPDEYRDLVLSWIQERHH